MKFGIQLHCPVSKSYDAIGDEYIYIFIVICYMLIAWKASCFG